MTRGAAAALTTPLHSASTVLSAVPAMLADDPLFAQLCGTADDLLAPLVVALDCLAAYLDPDTTPDDFLPWLAGVVGCAAGASRRQVREAGRRSTGGGTVSGVREAAAAAAEVPVADVAVDDSGGVSWSCALRSWPVGDASVPSPAPPAPQRAPSPPPGRSGAVVTVRVGAAADRTRVADAVVAAVDAARPANCQVFVHVEVQP